MASGRGSSRNIAVVTLGNLSAPAVALITAPILANGLGAVGRGEVAAATAPLMLCVAGLTVGMPEALTYFVARMRAISTGTVIRALIVSAVAGGFGSLAIALLAMVLADGDRQLATLISLCALGVVPALITGCCRGIARGRQKWRLVVAEQLVGAATRLIGLAGLLTLDMLTPATAAAVLTLGTFTGVLPYLALLKRENTEPTRVPSGELVRFGLTIWPGAVAGVLLSRIDQALFLPLSTAAALGVYAVAVSLSDVSRVFNAAVRDVIFARESAATDDTSLGTASRLSTLITAFMSIVVAIGVAVLAVPLFGQDFAEVPLVVVILLAGVIVGNPGSVVGAGVAARGRALLRSLAICIGVVLNVVLLLILAPPYGAVGAACAAAIANAVTGQTVLLLSRRVIRVPARDLLFPRRGDLSLLVTMARGLLRRGR
ncbi:hypothetical protein GCM10022219_22090 [Microbacterium oryzae]|uniref:Lipopolysaccharide biosynthesis protein n=1 Tax=Microbacterium oryzae TaxID=743009 RepID=A0A6I6DRK9_9MICO|nr:oligosaccharide flippase family protein [Microbacterium oryzae]QGU27562.1 lipopolysaccharide biosynthesis protein [Microbacterium oryzae]